ncbi:MAG TPA: SDR family oxidoreductase [Bacteroidales bacterium]|nr:SDR family oxidoreductase [Bacteroidales bacterium]HPF00355.1 SDR family oxidoreductase [Bacteroidales bacterium]
MKKIVLVSGATSGIGASCAHKFASAGYRVILCGRRSERLSALKQKLVSLYGENFFTLTFDIRSREQVFNAINSLPAEWENTDVLINNAGLALGLSSLQDGSIDHWEQMIDTNVKGLLYLTKAVVGQMIERKSGHVINIGSIAGRQAYANGNVYCATKAAVDSLTKSMRIDFLPYNIKVSQVAPGAAETEFSIVRFEGDQQRAADVYKGYTPLSADDVADAVLYLASLPPHVNVNDMLLMPTAQACAGIIHKE